MRRTSLWSALLLAIALGATALGPACGSSDPAPSIDAGNFEPADAGEQLADAGEIQDSGEPEDAGTVEDAGEPADAGDQDDAGVDAGEADAGPTLPLSGFGALSGDCDVLDDELASPEPSAFINHIDFGSDPYDDADLPLLTEGGQEIATSDNAGGSSILSEAFAFETLARCELATLLKTETEISYLDPQGKITDILVEIDGLKIGVSVVRAVGYPPENYPPSEATRILTRKLEGIAASTANVAPADAWQKQILKVIAYSPEHATTFQQAWDQADPALKGDTILMITVSDGEDAFLY